MDSAVFATSDTIKSIMNDSIEKGFNFVDNGNPDSIVSAVLVKASDGYDLEQLERDIFYNIEGIRVVEKQGVMTNVENNIKSFSHFIYIFAAMFLLLAIVTLNIVFSVSANERKKEFGLLRTVGFTGKGVATLLFKEAVIIGAIGWITGVVVATAVVFPFSTAIEMCFGMPYLKPSFFQLVLLIFITAIITIGVGTLSSVYSTLRISRMPIGFLLKEGE